MRNQKRENNAHWKGGKTINSNGYVEVLSPEDPRARISHPYIMEHILVVEKYIGRQLQQNECVHHKNGIKTDNRIENLQLVTFDEHRRMHNKLRTRRESVKALIQEYKL